MSDPNRDLLSELWTHDEARLRETSLQRMITEGRRRRSRRHAVGTALGAAVLLASGLWVWRPAARLPAPSGPGIEGAVPLAGAPADRPSVRQLTQAEVE